MISCLFVEQISLNLPWLGGNSLDQNTNNSSEATSNSSNNQQSLECKAFNIIFFLF